MGKPAMGKMLNHYTPILLALLFPAINSDSLELSENDIHIGPRSMLWESPSDECELTDCISMSIKPNQKCPAGKMEKWEESEVCPDGQAQYRCCQLKNPSDAIKYYGKCTESECITKSEDEMCWEGEVLLWMKEEGCELGKAKYACCRGGEGAEHFAEEVRVGNQPMIWESPKEKCFTTSCTDNGTGVRKCPVGMYDKYEEKDYCPEGHSQHRCCSELDKAGVEVYYGVCSQSVCKPKVEFGQCEKDQILLSMDEEGCAPFQTKYTCCNRPKRTPIGVQQIEAQFK